MVPPDHSRSPGGAREASPAALAFGLTFPALLTAVYFVGLADAPRAAQQGVYLTGKAIQFGLPAAWALRREGSRAFSLPGARGALVGALFGLGVLIATLALYEGLLVPLHVLDGGPAAAIRAKVAGLGVTGPWRFLALGITVLLGLEAFVNMAVVTGLVPTKGLALPFISYGGSSLIVSLFAVGVLLNVSSHLKVNE